MAGEPHDTRIVERFPCAHGSVEGATEENAAVGRPGQRLDPGHFIRRGSNELPVARIPQLDLSAAYRNGYSAPRRIDRRSHSVMLCAAERRANRLPEPALAGE